MDSLHTISCSFNDLGFRPLNWEQFKKLDKGKALISEDKFELYTIDGEKMSGTLSLTEVVEDRNWYAKEYVANFSETGLNCFFSLCWQKLKDGLSKNCQLDMHCLANQNYWYYNGTIAKQ